MAGIILFSEFSLSPKMLDYKPSFLVLILRGVLCASKYMLYFTERLSLSKAIP